MKLFFRNFKDPKYYLKILIIAAIYFGAAKFGLSLSTPVKQITLIWPATGVSVAALIIFGIEYWPAIFIGAFISDFTSMEPILTALGIATASTLEAALPVYLLIKFHFNRLFIRIKDVLMFVLFACILNTLLTAVFGTSALILGGIDSWRNFRFLTQNWWAGDFLGAIVVAPFLIVWSDISKFRLPKKRIFEAFILVLVVSLVSVSILTGTFSIFTFGFQYQVKYFVFPLLLWGSYRFGVKGSTLLMILVSTIAIWGSITGSGPFINLPNFESTLLYLGIFLATAAFTSILFSVIIEQRNFAEIKVLASEKRFRSLIENSSDAIVAITASGLITYASPSVKKMLGYEPHELEGESGFKIIYSEDAKISREKLGELLRKPNTTMNLENRLVFKDGTIHWMEAYGINLLSDPSVHAIVINFRDINDRKQMDLVKSEFVSLSAHQMRTPLSSMRWYTEAVLKAKNLPKDIRKYVDEVYFSILRMNDTVNLLLDVSRFELGTVKVSGETVELRDIINNVIEEKKAEYSAKNLNLTYIAGKIPQIIGDSKLIRIIIENLINNAIKYTPEKGKITIRTIPQRSEILFSVEDTGIGIPYADQSKIFTKLFRGSNVGVGEPKGLGLGLYLTKLIVNLKGGRIWFESKEGAGSTFYVEFPKKIKITK